MPTIFGTEGNDVINGGGTSDIIYGFEGDDVLNGYGANDVLDGGTGSDTMTGGIGDDTYYVDSIGDVVIEYSGPSDGSSDNVRTTLASYVLTDNVEYLYYDHANAAVVSDFTGQGNASGNGIHGWTGNDALYGLGGNDTLYGYGGNDTLDGGAGSDYFVFNTALGADNVDTILNYVAADDTIRLENAVFTALTATGTLSSAAFCVGTAALDASDRIIYDSATGDLWYDADGTGAKAAVKFATLVGVTDTVTNADFVVI